MSQTKETPYTDPTNADVGRIPIGDEIFEHIPADAASDEEDELMGKKPGGRDARKRLKEKNKGHTDASNYRK